MVDFKHGKICYIFMPSQTPERSGAFYRDLFGWSLRTNREGGLSFDDSTSQVSGHWVTDRPPASEHNLEVHIMIDDLDATIAATEPLAAQSILLTSTPTVSDGQPSRTSTGTGSASISSQALEASESL